MKVAYWGNVIVVIFCKRLLQLKEIVLFIGEMNEPVMVIQPALFTCDYNYPVVYGLTAFLQSIVHIC